MSENMIVDTAIDGLTEEASAGGREGGREGGEGMKKEWCLFLYWVMCQDACSTLWVCPAGGAYLS